MMRPNTANGRRARLDRLARWLPVVAAAVIIAAAASAQGSKPEAAAAASAQGSKPEAAAAAPVAETGGAALVLFNRTVFVFKVPNFGVPPEERARTARERVAALLARPGEHSVSAETVPQGAMVRVDGSFAFFVTAEDADALNEETALGAAQRAARMIEVVAAETRESRDMHAMLRAAGTALAATAILVTLLWVLARARQALGRGLQRLTDEHPGWLRIRGVELIQREHALKLLGGAVRIAVWGIVLLLAYEWLSFVLGRFPYTRPWGEQLTEFLLGTGQGILEGSARAVPDLFVAVIIFLIARVVVRLLNGFFDRVQAGAVTVTWLDTDTVRPTRRLITIVIWIFVLVMAYPYLPGSDTEAFKGISVLVGLMVSVGASSIFGQGASGLILMYTRTMRPGEYVRIGEHEGTIVILGMFATRLRTGLGEELTLPNAFILGTVVKNYSRTVSGEGFVADAAVTIGYDAPWRQVHAMLIEAAGRTPGVLAEPAPRVFQTALSDFYVEYRLVCQAIPSEPRPRAEVMSALHANIQDVFNEHGVQIMSPHYFGDPAEAKVVPKAKWYAAPAASPDRSPPE